MNSLVDKLLAKKMFSTILDEPSRCMKEMYDLQGLKVVSTALTWKPFLFFENCDEDGLSNCQSGGMFYDFIQMLSIM
jgi:hypothetical protein